MPHKPRPDMAALIAQGNAEAEPQTPPQPPSATLRQFAAANVATTGSSAIEAPAVSPSGKPYKRVGLYLAPAVKREIDTIAFTHERKPHDLYLEAIDLLLKRYGRPSIEDFEKKA